MNHLERLAQRVAADPAFLAFALALYAESEGIDDDVLAAHMKCRREDLTMIRLCLMPAPEPAAFRRDIEQIAGRFGADIRTLAEMVRRGQVLATMRAAAAPEQGTLLAARDDDPEGES